MRKNMWKNLTMTFLNYIKNNRLTTAPLIRHFSNKCRIKGASEDNFIDRELCFLYLPLQTRGRKYEKGNIEIERQT
jgi:hypothetical protein